MACEYAAHFVTIATPKDHRDGQDLRTVLQRVERIRYSTSFRSQCESLNIW